MSGDICTCIPGDPTDENFEELHHSPQELTNFVEPRLAFMDPGIEEYGRCQRCRRLSSFARSNSKPSEMANGSDQVTQHRHHSCSLTCKDSGSVGDLYIVKTDSYNPETNNINVNHHSNHFSTSHRDDAPFILVYVITISVMTLAFSQSNSTMIMLEQKRKLNTQKPRSIPKYEITKLEDEIKSLKEQRNLTIHNILEGLYKDSLKTIYPRTGQFLGISCILPISNAISERGFSHIALQCGVLQGSMKDETLDNLLRIRFFPMDLTRASPVLEEIIDIFERDFNKDRHIKVTAVMFLPTMAAPTGSNVDDQLRVSFSSNTNSSSHCHAYQPEISASARKARRQLIISSILCLIFMVAEVVGGYFANSLAIMTDAAHMLSDFASFMISLFAVYVGQKKPTRKMSFGYYRAEVLGAVTSVLIIWLISGVIVYMAIERIIKHEFHIDADIMIIVAGSGVAMNILMGVVLHGMCNCHTHSHGFGNHGHSHGGGDGHSHGGSHENSHNGDHKEPQNINVRAAFIHVIGDLIQSIGVLIAAFIIKYKPEYKLADPICTFIFSVVVLFTTVAIMKDALYVLMEGFPKGIDYFSVIGDLTRVAGVKSVHSLHIWSLTMDKNALSAHLAIEPGQDSQSVLKEALSLVRGKYDIFHPTIQVEVFEPDMVTCSTCQGPTK
ncbi:Zinc transporter 2 [Nymphon striatum]|nr:Zinc transporter 2 [Nymphon striatum]